MTAGTISGDPLREKALQEYRTKLCSHKEIEAKLKECK